MVFAPYNKHGRGRPPAGQSLSEALRVALTEKLPDGRTNYRAVADALVAKARGGDVAAIREVFDRVEGKAIVASEAGGPRPINISILPQDEATL